jgi:acyl transferase domain-containing protein
VRFADGVQVLLQETDVLLLEVGPGQTLNQLARANRAPVNRVISTLGGVRDVDGGSSTMLAALGKLWAAGVQVNWRNFHRHERLRRIPLPTYPFERQRYRIEEQKNGNGHRVAVASIASKRNDVSDWFYVPSWKRSAPLPPPVMSRTERWLVLADELGVAERFAQRLQDLGQEVVKVRAGAQFTKESDYEWQIDPRNAADYSTLCADLVASDRYPQHVVHFGSLTTPLSGVDGSLVLRRDLDHGFYSVLNLTQALVKQPVGAPVRLAVITDRAEEVSGSENVRPGQAPVLGACKVIQLEYPELLCRNLDVEVVGPNFEKVVSEQVLSELVTDLQGMVSYRGGYRWTQTFEPLRPDKAAMRVALRAAGVYLITGGLGQIGLQLAHHLAREVKAKLILTSRKGLPERKEWDAWLGSHRSDDLTSRQIMAVKEMDSLGAEVLCEAADVSSETEMEAVVHRAEQRFGRIDGVVHAAGDLSPAGFRRINEINRAECERHFMAKAYGTIVLEKVLRGRELDFRLLCSSLSTVLGGLGYVAYAGANSFLDVFACQRRRADQQPWTSVAWDGWNFTEQVNDGRSQTALTIEPSAGMQAFDLLLSGLSAPQVIVSTGDLEARIKLWTTSVTENAVQPDSQAAANLYPRPELPNEYVEPGNDTERAIGRIWQQLLGVDRVGIHDNFFDLGGHSLLATQVMAEMKKVYPGAFSVADLFERPTVQSLSKLVLDDKQTTTLSESSNRGQKRKERKLRARMANEENVAL